VTTLEAIVGVKRAEFVDHMFNAKSNVEGLSLETVTTTDYKSFTIHGIHFGFGVCETTNPEQILAQKDELLKVLKKIKREQEVSLMFFVVVDVMKLTSKMVILGQDEDRVAKAALQGTMIEANIFDVGSLVSRKKDFIPPLSRFFRSEE